MIFQKLLFPRLLNVSKSSIRKICGNLPTNSSQISSGVPMFQFPSRFANFIIQSIKTIPHVAVIAGPILLTIGIGHWVYTNIFINNSIESKITVVAMDVKDGKRRPLYRPEFEVSDSGKRMNFSGNHWVSPKPHEIGDVVDGRYDPSSGKIVSNIMLRREKYLSSLLTNMGAIFFVLGLGYFWWRRKRRNDGWRE